MLLKAVGQPLGTAKRVLESPWEMPKDYWKAAGQFYKGYRKAAGKCPNTRYRLIGEEAEFLSGYWQKHGNFHPFSLKHHIFV
jgi:hypothetical protein